MANDKRREDGVRRRLAKAGYGVRKDPYRHITAHHLGGFMVYDLSTNAVVRGDDYEYTLDDLEQLAVEGDDYERAPNDLEQLVDEDEMEEDG